MLRDDELLSMKNEFLGLVGAFQQAWANAEVAIDLAIRDLLRLTTDEAHLLTAGLEFNRKASLLRSLIGKSDYKKKAQAVKALNTMQNESKRNVFAHSYIASNRTTVSYIERSRGGKYKATEHNFTLLQFAAHTSKFAGASMEFSEALGQTDAEINAFGKAALAVKATT